MNKLWLSAAILLASLSVGHGAAAFSTDHSTAQNSDGSPKFADPDEQKPGFMVGPDNSSAKNLSLSFGSSAVTPPSAGDNDSGARAFDRAFAHQQDKE